MQDIGGATDIDEGDGTSVVIKTSTRQVRNIKNLFGNPAFQFVTKLVSNIKERGLAF